MRALFTAATGMEAQQLRIDTIANNLANVTTTGFKKGRAEFQDLFYETLQAPGAQAADGQVLPVGVQIGHGVRIASVNTVFSEGERQNTARAFDVAIEGDGFLQFQKPDGETVYSRDGSLNLDSEGNIVNANGYLMIPAIQVPIESLEVTILPDGTVNQTIAGQIQANQLGQIELARFVNPAGLRSLGGNLFSPTDASGQAQTGPPDADGFGAVAQGFLENSNVNVAEELVNMILAQRAFEVNSRAIQAGDQMMQTVAGISR